MTDDSRDSILEQIRQSEGRLMMHQRMEARRAEKRAQRVMDEIQIYKNAVRRLEADVAAIHPRLASLEGERDERKGIVRAAITAIFGALAAMAASWWASVRK